PQLVVVPGLAVHTPQTREIRVIRAFVDERAVHERKEVQRAPVPERVEIDVFADRAPPLLRVTVTEERHLQHLLVDRAVAVRGGEERIGVHERARLRAIDACSARAYSPNKCDCTMLLFRLWMRRRSTTASTSAVDRPASTNRAYQSNQ